MKGCVDRREEAVNFLFAAFAAGPAGHPPGGFEDHRIHSVPGKVCPFEDALVGEKHVAGVEDALVIVFQRDADGTRYVPGVMEGDAEALPVVTAEEARVVARERETALIQPLHFSAGEEGVRIDAVLLLLPHHHIAGIVEHPTGKELGGGTENENGFRVLPHQHGNGAEVVEVAVGEENEVYRLAAGVFDLGKGFGAHQFRIHPGIDHQPERAELKENGIGSDAAAGVQVSELHELGE